ncbi:sensor histidine kinase [Paenibacillus chartarius]|uniref:histidine kinase n=1 Tax=Paenibacillus chartarius TaxID=747481 RepID=A0ABV6DFI2_9BACL
MFRRLRNKFLLLNMVTISIMMLLAFASIYIIVDQNLRRDIDMDLHKAMDVSRKPMGNPGSGSMKPAPSSGMGEPRMDGPQGRSMSFTLVTDKEGKVKSAASRYELGDEFYTEAAASALSGGGTRSQGKLKLDDNYWAYLVQPSPDGYMISFVDINAQRSFLTKLVYAFLIVASVMLVLIFFISRFFANRSIGPVQEAFNKQKQFIADASHELKTPLAVINTNVDVLLGNPDDTIRNQAKWLQFIKSESERMSTLTSELLYLAQIDQTNPSVMHAPFDVSDALEQVILTMEAVIFEANIGLSYEIEPALTARGSIEQYKQVAMILLDNAVKYTTAGGSMEVVLKKRSQNIVLTVTNTGEGIAEEHLDRIFDRFYRTDPSRTRSQGSYGLGLAIAKAIIDQHRGRIYARNLEGGKVSFVVELPIAG